MNEIKNAKERLKYRENPDKKKVDVKAYYDKKQPEIIEKKKKYYKENRDVVLTKVKVKRLVNVIRDMIEKKQKLVLSHDERELILNNLSFVENFFPRDKYLDFWILFA